MSRKKKTDGVQDALIPDEITPLMLLALTAKASRMKDAAAAFRIAASKMLDLATKDEYIEKIQEHRPHHRRPVRRLRSLAAHLRRRQRGQRPHQLSGRGPRARGEGGYRAQFVGSVA